MIGHLLVPVSCDAVLHVDMRAKADFGAMAGKWNVEIPSGGLGVVTAMANISLVGSDHRVLRLSLRIRF